MKKQPKKQSHAPNHDSSFAELLERTKSAGLKLPPARLAILRALSGNSAKDESWLGA